MSRTAGLIVGTTPTIGIEKARAKVGKDRGAGDDDGAELNSIERRAERRQPFS